VVTAAAGNWSSGREVIELLFERKGNQHPITEEVMTAATRDEWRKVMELLLEHKGRRRVTRN
jgi:hypothetical protein